MIRSLLWTLASIAGAGFAFAAVVPQPETPEEIAARVKAARAAKSALEALGEGGSWSDFDRRNPIVIQVKDSGQEPWSDALRRLHSAFVWHKPARGRREFIANVSTPADTAGVQFVRRGSWPAVDLQTSAELWLDNAFVFNGASESALISLTNWCRRGGDYRLPKNCVLLRKSARERGVWDQTAQ